MATAEHPKRTGHLRVLVATDGSEASLEAAREAARLFGDGADLVLVTVVDAIEDPMADAGGFEGPVIDQNEAERHHREEVVAAEAALAATARAIGPEPLPQEIVEHGNESVGERICRLAEESGADIVVMGSHGHRAIVEVLLGSVSTYVVHHSPCPVLVVRGTDS
jgi:nucleotide-binding universal stress UspA family protein